MIDLCELLFARGLPKGDRLTKLVRHQSNKWDIESLVSHGQYVGSAHGAAGILGRWKSYARTGHGGNQLLRDLLAKNPQAANAFQFSILRALPPSLTKDEVLGNETMYKKKLGSRAHGLNAN